MKQKKIDTINTSGFKVPDDYFSQVEEQILNEAGLKSKVDASGFNVPDSYFENLDNKIIDKLKEDREVKVVSLFNRKNIIYASTIAATLILMFNVFFNASETITFDSLEIATIENYLEEEDYTSYELAMLLTEEELSKDSFIDNKISKRNIEDYLLENVEIEDLIIE